MHLLTLITPTPNSVHKHHFDTRETITSHMLFSLVFFLFLASEVKYHCFLDISAIPYRFHVNKFPLDSESFSSSKISPKMFNFFPILGAEI